jgi:hypothetical protein
MYKLYKNPDNQEIIGVQKNQNMWIPFAPNNTDYANFKKEINAETVELQDAEGNTMTAAEAKAYVATLP